MIYSRWLGYSSQPRTRCKMETLLQQSNTIASIFLSKWINTGDRILDNTLLSIGIVAFSSMLYYIKQNWVVPYNMTIFYLYGMYKNPLNVSAAPYAFRGYEFENEADFKRLVFRTSSYFLTVDINDTLKKRGSNIIIKSSHILKIIEEYRYKNNIQRPLMKNGDTITFDDNEVIPIAISNKGHLVYYLSSRSQLTSTGSINDSMYIEEPLREYIVNEIISKNTIDTFDQIYVPKMVSMKTVHGHVDTFELKSIGPVNKKKTFDTLFYPQKAELLAILQKFRDGKMYPAHIPMDNKLGIILYGPPGTGKTGTVSAIANMLKRNLLVINFTTITTCKQFDEILDCKNYSKYVYVFDEFDCILDVISGGGAAAATNREKKEDWAQLLLCAEGEERKSILEMVRQGRTRKDDSPIDLAYLLQKLDGLETAENRIIIATTNNPDKINPALLRPGRFDIKICLGLCTSEMAVNILTNFYKGEREKIQATNIPAGKYSPLELINMAIQAANIPAGKYSPLQLINMAIQAPNLDALLVQLHESKY